MSRYTDLFPEVAAEVDDEFGEPLGLRPWKSGKYTSGGVADPARPPRDVIGTFSEARGGMSSSGGDGKFRGETMPTLAPRAMFLLSLFASVDEWPREGDKIVRLEPIEKPEYQVTLAESDDLARLIVHLIRL